MSDEIMKNAFNETLRTYAGPDKVIPIEEKIEQIKERIKNRPAYKLSVGIDSLDKCLDGFRKGQIVVISGAPKHGKTSLGLSFTKNFIDEGHKCLWFEFEVHEEEFMEKVPPDIIGKFKMYSPNQLPAKGAMAWLEQRIVEAKLKHEVDVVFIDNVDFLKDPEVSRSGSANMSEHLDSIYTHLKNIARIHELVIFVFHHIRKSEWRSNNLPSSEELKNGAAPVAIGDIIFMMMRRVNRDKDADSIYDGNRAVIGIQENRFNGKTKKIAAVFDAINRIYVEELYIEPPIKNKSFYG